MIAGISKSPEEEFFGAFSFCNLLSNFHLQLDELDQGSIVLSATPDLIRAIEKEDESRVIEQTAMALEMLGDHEALVPQTRSLRRG